MKKLERIAFRPLFRLGIGGAGFLLILGCSTLGSRTPPPLSKGPYLQAPNTNAMAIMWESLTNLPGIVRFGADGTLGQRAGPITPRRMVGVSASRLTNIVTTVTNGTVVVQTNRARGSVTNVFYVYQAALTNLQPGVVYTYTVELAGRRTAPRTFKTFNARADSVRFIAYGDSRSNPKVHAALARQFLDQSPEFILHTGDLVLVGKDYGQWSREFFEPLANVIDRVPVLSVPGNHEEDLKSYRAYFPMRSTNIWYSFDAGPVHVLALDFYSQRETDRQFKFARQDLLGSRAPWKVVMVHNPIFNFGHHHSGWGHQVYLPLFHEAKVDLVVAGHSHMYERFRPVAPTRKSGSWAITCITTAGGGAELNKPDPHPAQAVAISTNHFTVIEATNDELRVRAIRTDGVLIDAFTIRKSGGQQAPEYLDQVYPEELLETAYEVRSILFGKLASLPTNQHPAQAMLTFPPLKTTHRPVELEITLVPESAQHYAVKEFPLRVQTPASGETNKVVWITVNAVSKKKVHGPELDPPLVFKARVIGELGETLAYGLPSRTSRTDTDAAKKLAPE
jgi:acid phosphatase type 7